MSARKPSTSSRGCAYILLAVLLLPVLAVYGLYKMWRSNWPLVAKAAVTAGAGLVILLIVIVASSGSPATPEPRTSAAKATVASPSPTPTTTPTATPTPTPQPTAKPAPPAAPAPTPRPVPATPRPTPPPPPPSTPVPASCHPLSDEGTCYEPGEYCRDSDHGVVGLAGDGETIVCEDNDGWRWEPE